MMTLRDRIAARFYIIYIRAHGHLPPAGVVMESDLETAVSEMNFKEMRVAKGCCYFMADAVIADIKRTMSEEDQARLNEHGQREVEQKGEIDIPHIPLAVPTGRRHDQPAKVIQLRENLKVEGGAELQREVKVPDTICGLWRDSQGEAVLQATYSKDYVRCTHESVGVLRREGYMMPGRHSGPRINDVIIYVCQDHRKLRKEINRTLRSTYVGKQLAQHGIDLGGYKFIPHRNVDKEGDCKACQHHITYHMQDNGGCEQCEMYGGPCQPPGVFKLISGSAQECNHLESLKYTAQGKRHCAQCIDDSLNKEHVEEKKGTADYLLRNVKLNEENHLPECGVFEGCAPGCKVVYGTAEEYREIKRSADEHETARAIVEQYKPMPLCAICKHAAQEHNFAAGCQHLHYGSQKCACKAYVDPTDCVEQRSDQHQWDDSGERCLKCGDKDWMASAKCPGPATSATLSPRTLSSVPQSLSSTRVRDESPVAIDCKICGHLEPGQPHDNEKHKNDPKSLYYFREPSENYRYELVKEALDPAPGSVFGLQDAAEQAQDEKAPQNAGSEPSREPTSEEP